MDIRTKVSTTAAEAGVQAAEILVRIHLLKYYVDTVGLPANWASYAAGIAILWDAVSDPLVGIWSDRVQSRFGQRKPFILAGAIVLSLAVVALFSPPDFSTNAATFTYLLVAYIAMNTGVTLIAVPHAALVSEVAENAAQRTTLFGYRLGLGNLGLLLGTLIPGLLVATTPGSPEAVSNPPSYTTSGLGIGLLIVLSAVVTLRSRLDKPPPSLREGSELQAARPGLSELMDAMRNRAFIPLFLAYAVAMIGMGVNGSLALYYYVDKIHLGQDQISLVLMIFLVVWTASIAFWVTLANRIGKRPAGFWGILLLGIVTSGSYPFFPADRILFPILIAVVGGFLIGSVVLLDAVVGDIVDYDELKHRRRREGLFFGFWKLGGKLARALSIVVAGLLLDAIGVKPGVPRTEEAVWWISFAFGPGVGLFFVVGAFLFLSMPLDKAQVNRIARLQTRLRARRRR